MADQDYARWAMGLLPTSDPTHKPHQTTISENPSSSLWDEDFKISAGWSYLGHAPKFLWIGMGKTMENQERPAAWAAKLMAEALGTRTGTYDLVRPCAETKRVDKPSGLQKPWETGRAFPEVQEPSTFAQAHQGSIHDNSLVGRCFMFNVAEQGWAQDLSSNPTLSKHACYIIYIIFKITVIILLHDKVKNFRYQQRGQEEQWKICFSCATYGSSAKDAKYTCSTAVGGMLGYLAGHQVLNMVKQTLGTQHGKSKQEKTLETF